MSGLNLKNDPNFKKSVQELRDWFYEQEPLRTNSLEWALRTFKEQRPNYLPDGIEHSDPEEFSRLIEAPEGDLYWFLLSYYLESAVQELTVQVIDPTRG